MTLSTPMAERPARILSLARQDGLLGELCRSDLSRGLAFMAGFDLDQAKDYMGYCELKSLWTPVPNPAEFARWGASEDELGIWRVDRDTLAAWYEKAWDLNLRLPPQGERVRSVFKASGKSGFVAWALSDSGACELRLGQATAR